MATRDEIKHGAIYVYSPRFDRTQSTECRLISPHPDDGAYLVMSRWDEVIDEEVFFGCEREELAFLRER